MYLKHGMTLIELLAVISIILVLASLVGSGVMGARAQASKVQCLSNLRALGQGALLYAQSDPAGNLPYSATDGQTFGLLYDPITFSDMSVFVCPLKTRNGLPAKPATKPYSVTIALNSYRFVLDNAGQGQSLSYPSGNIILMENFDSTTLIFNHGPTAIPVYLLNGKCKVVEQNGLSQNANKSEVTYAITTTLLKG